MGKNGGYLGGGTIIRVHPVGEAKSRARLGLVDISRQEFSEEAKQTSVLRREDIEAQKKKKQRKEHRLFKKVSASERRANSRKLLEVHSGRSVVWQKSSDGEDGQ